MDQAHPHLKLARCNPSVVHLNQPKPTKFPIYTSCEDYTARLFYISMAAYNPLCTEWTRHTKYSVRCKQCNKDNAALQRLFQKCPPIRKELHDKFSTDEESRSEFIRRSRGLLGKDLKALVETMLQEKTSETKACKRKKLTEFLDEAELKKRFVHKPPEQLEKVLAECYAFTHPDSGADLYALSTFVVEHPHLHFAMYD